MFSFIKLNYVLKGFDKIQDQKYWEWNWNEVKVSITIGVSQNRSKNKKNEKAI